MLALLDSSTGIEMSKKLSLLLTWSRWLKKRKVNFALIPTWIFCMLSLLNSLLSLFASWSQKSPELLVLSFHNGSYCSFTLYNEAKLSTGYSDMHIFFIHHSHCNHSHCWNFSSIVLIQKASHLPCDLTFVFLESLIFSAMYLIPVAVWLHWWGPVSRTPTEKRRKINENQSTSISYISIYIYIYII